MQTTAQQSTSSEITLPEDPIFRRLKILQTAWAIKHHGANQDLSYKLAPRDCTPFDQEGPPCFEATSGSIRIYSETDDLFGLTDFSGSFGAERLSGAESSILTKAIRGRIRETDLKDTDISTLSISSRHDYLKRVVRGVGKLYREEQMDISYACTGSGVRISSFQINKGNGDGYALPDIKIRRIGTIYDTYDGTLNGQKLSYLECDKIVKALKRAVSGIFWTPFEDY